MQSNITLVTIMASCAGFLLFFFVVAFLHFHEYLDYHCLRDRVFFSSKTLITILPSLHYQLHYHIALGLAIPKMFSKEFVNRRWFDLRDRWQVHLKPVLQQPEFWETTEALKYLDFDLLTAVADTGARSLVEVPWDRVKQEVPGHLPAFLKNRLRGLTRQQSETASNLHDKVCQTLQNMKQGTTLGKGLEKRKGSREISLRKTQERNASLVEYYQYLISKN